MKEKRTVCFIIPTTDPGGTENYALRAIRHIKDEFNFIVISTGSRKGSLQKEFLTNSSLFIHFPVRYWNLFAVFSYLRLFKKHHVDTVVNFNGDFAGVSVMAAKLARVEKRVVFYRRSTHAFRPTLWRRIYNGLLHKFVFHGATTILSNSKTAFDNFFGIKSGNPRFKLIYNGVDATLTDIQLTKAEARSVLGVPNGLFIIGHVGRVDPAKNHSTILRVAFVLKTYSNIRFLFCGKGTEEQSFRDKIAESGLEDVCILLGTRDDVPVVMRALDIFLFPSLTEGQPNALIEAMISGVPFIASDIQPIKDSIPPEKHSALVNPNDDAAIIKAVEGYMQRVGEGVDARTRKWATEKYDHCKNFNLLKDEL